MAIRPVFVSELSGDKLVSIYNVDFEWFAGMHFTQKQKSIRSLHESYLTMHPGSKMLEVSSKSEIELGVNLSAFNLMVNKNISVESVFQASKVFSGGGPYTDIMQMSSKDAKRDPRIQNSGNLIRFQYKETSWDLEPKTAFYDWLYLNTLNLHDDLKNHVLEFDSFTDIEFNPKKSINCQAYAVALFVALTKRELLPNNRIPPKFEFISLIEQFQSVNSSEGLLL